MYQWRRVGLWGLALAAALASAACDDTPTSPSPPPAQLTLTCPAAQTAVSTTGQPVSVTWQGRSPRAARHQSRHLHARVRLGVPGRHNIGGLHGDQRGSRPICQLFVHGHRHAAAAAIGVAIHGVRRQHHLGIKSDHGRLSQLFRTGALVSYPNRLRVLLAPGRRPGVHGRERRRTGREDRRRSGKAAFRACARRP